MAQQQGLLTVTGYVGANPTQFNRGDMPHASSFRLASTRHYFDGRTQQWKDLPTTWITVKAYRGLSESICQSFKKGEPVIVTGVLAAENWVDQSGKQQSRLVMEANAAGHDLNYGVSTLRRLAKQSDQQNPQDDQSPADRPAQRRAVDPVEVLGTKEPGDNNAAEPPVEDGEFDGDAF